MSATTAEEAIPRRKMDDVNFMITQKYKGQASVGVKGDREMKKKWRRREEKKKRRRKGKGKGKR